MANFCANCGRPLENGRCPVCGSPAASPSASSGETSSGTPFFSALCSDLKSLLSSRDPFRIAPAAGFVVLALICLLVALFSVSGSIPFELYSLSFWPELTACIAVGLGSKALFVRPLEGSRLLAGCICALIGLMGVLHLLCMLTQRYFPFDYLLPCMLLLMLGLGLTEQDRLLRLFCLGGAGALVLVLLVLLFSVVLPVLPQLALCWCYLCAAMAVAKGRFPA